MTYNNTMYNLGLQQVRLNKAQLDATNAIYADGQLIIETDTNTYTTGDGTSNYRTIRGNTELNADERRSADDLLAAMTSPKRFKALVTQSSTNAPTMSVQVNGLGGVPIWSYNDVGNYTLTLAGAFPKEKTVAFTQNSYGDAAAALQVSVVVASDGNSIEVQTGTGEDTINGVLSDAPFLIEVEQ